MQLSFSNHVSAVPRFLSSKAAQEDGPSKGAHDHLVSSGFMTIPTADSSQKPYSGLTQAQAIMLLAGNGSSAAQSKTAPMTKAQTPIPRSCSADASVGNNCSTMSTLSGLPSHLSVTSHVSLQSGGGSSGTNDLTVATRIGASACTNQPEPPKSFNSVGSAWTALIPAVAVPQARKASLTRFLEKRKERATNTSPYSISKKSPVSGPLASDNIRRVHYKSEFLSLTCFWSTSRATNTSPYSISKKSPVSGPLASDNISLSVTFAGSNPSSTSHQ